MCKWKEDPNGGWWHISCRPEIPMRWPKPGSDMHCPYCGELIEDGGRFYARGTICSACGGRYTTQQSGFCLECEAQGWAGDERRHKAIAALSRRRSRRA